MRASRALRGDIPGWDPVARRALLSRDLPGGFGGVTYDRGQRLYVLLVERAAFDTLRRMLMAASAAAPGTLPPPEAFARAKSRVVRRSFVDLFDWRASLERAGFGIGTDVHGSAIDEWQNRLLFIAPDSAAHARLRARLAAVPVPCGLVATVVGRFVLD